jgi:hypothetical protein
MCYLTTATLQQGRTKFAGDLPLAVGLVIARSFKVPECLVITRFNKAKTKLIF